MRKLHTNSDGFTVIELLVFILVLSVIAVVALSNIRTIRAQNRDQASKTDINATYYQLESFHEKRSYEKGLINGGVYLLEKKLFLTIKNRT